MNETAFFIYKIMEIHGHRGCRGYYPENTIEGFLYAVELGCTAIELDVVVSKDNQLVVSHEPWMNHLFCVTPKGDRITEEEEKCHNIFDMTFEEIQQYDCGRRIDDKYPDQLNKKSRKPSLQRVVDVLKGYDVKINIEVKSDKEWYGEFQPHPKEFSALVHQFILDNNLSQKCIVQSFDVEFLNEFKTRSFESIELGLLVENEIDVNAQLVQLDFIPEYFNPEYVLLTEEVLSELHSRSIKVLVWTVNNKESILRMKKLGVDGIISDYPNIVIELLNKKI